LLFAISLRAAHGHGGVGRDGYRSAGGAVIRRAENRLERLVSDASTTRRQ
jgi:hypothetical protein